MMNVKGSESSLARSAIAAALERKSSGLQEMHERIARVHGEQSPAVERPGFSQLLAEGIRKADETVASVNELPARIIKGEIDLHEAAAQIQMSKISFEFTMELRNKFIDAYREIMRMSV